VTPSTARTEPNRRETLRKLTAEDIGRAIAEAARL